MNVKKHCNSQSIKLVKNYLATIQEEISGAEERIGEERSGEKERLGEEEISDEEEIICEEERRRFFLGLK